jgi:hypothetical protein
MNRFSLLNLHAQSFLASPPNGVHVVGVVGFYLSCFSSIVYLLYYFYGLPFPSTYREILFPFTYAIWIPFCHLLPTNPNAHTNQQQPPHTLLKTHAIFPEVVVGLLLPCFFVSVARGLPQYKYLSTTTTTTTTITITTIMISHTLVCPLACVCV